jgi:hypothetical protein
MRMGFTLKELKKLARKVNVLGYRIYRAKGNLELNLHRPIRIVFYWFRARQSFLK